MKKYVWMVALIAALAMVFTGCGGGSSGGGEITISFDLDGGTYNGAASITAKKIKDGESLGDALPTTGMVKAGNTFQGWNNGSAAVDGTTTFSKNTTLKAQWEAIQTNPDTFTAIFQSNGGSDVTTIVNIETGAKITKPTDPTKADNDFAGWYKEAGLTTAWDFDTDVVTTHIILYAKWTPSEEVGPELFVLPAYAFELGEMNLENNATQKGWVTNGVDGITTTLTADVVVGSEYLVLYLPSTPTGTLQFIWQGNGDSWGWDETAILTNTGGALADMGASYAETADGTIVLIIDLSKAAKNYDKFIASTQIKLILAYYSSNIASLNLIEAYLLNPDYVPPTPVDPALIGVERVSLSNASQAVYRFVLPAGKTWGDYAKVSADYLIPEAATFDGENSGRAIRLYGNYSLDFFQFNETTAGNKYAYASLDGTANNNAYILAQEGGGWMTLSAALIALFGECPEANEWFTIDYTIDGSKSNFFLGNPSAPHPHLPDASDTGTFIFGLGLPGQDGTNTFHVKNIKLVGKSGTADVAAIPLYITKDGYDYPAFSAYGTASGNGVDNIRRAMLDGTTPPAVPFEASPEVTVTFNLNAAGDSAAAFDPANFSGSKTFIQGNQIGSLPSATRSAGWIFGGWATTAIGTSAIATTTTYAVDGELFAIWTYDAPEGTPIPLTIAAVNITATGNAVVTNVTNGFKVEYSTAANSNYGSPNAWFQLTQDLTTIKAITFDFTPIAGDVNGKGVYMVASGTAHGWASDDTYTNETISSTQNVTATTTTLDIAQSVKLMLVADKVEALSGTVYFAIRIHANNTGSLPEAGAQTTFSITNIKLIPFAD